MGTHIIFPLIGQRVRNDLLTYLQTIKYHFHFCFVDFSMACFVASCVPTRLMVLFTDSDLAEKYSICWRIGNFLSGWRLSPFYVALGVALLMWPNALWLSSVAGIQLLILAILRLLTIFRFQANTSRCESLLQKHTNQHHHRDYFDK